MSLDPYIVLGSAVVGFLVGMTGAGGGALMTPMLILFFGVKPSTAISSDLVAAVLMRPVGAVVHMTKKTVNYSLVGWMVLGSVPAALLGAYALHLMGQSTGAEHTVQIIARRRAAAGRGRHGAALRARPSLGPAPPGPDRRARRSAVAHGRHRGRRGLRGRDDLGGLGVADDRAAALPLPRPRCQPARRHGPDPGRPADAGGARSAPSPSGTSPSPSPPPSSSAACRRCSSGR